MGYVKNISHAVLGQGDSRELWEEIVSHIPDEVFLKKDVRILNVACGHAEETKAIMRRMLALGRTKKEIKNAIVLNDKYSCFTARWYSQGFEVVTGDFLEWETDMKFDVVIGNPPYQNPGKTKGQKLWYRFVFKAHDLVKADGYLCFVTPNSWMSGGFNKGRDGVFKDIFAKEQLLCAHVSGVSSRYFKGVGIDISWWVLHRAPITSETLLIMEDGTLSLNLAGKEFLSPIPTAIANSITVKVLTKPTKKYPIIYFDNRYKDGSTEEEKKKPSKKFSYKHWIMGSDVSNSLEVSYLDHNRHNSILFPKILFRVGSRYWQPYYDREGVSVVSQGFAIPAEKGWTKKGFVSVFYSKLFKFVCFSMQLQRNGFMKTSIVRSLPYIDLSRTWTDEELYEHFGLTQEEIDYIEATVK